MQERQYEQNTDHAIQQVADRQSIGGKVLPPTSLKHRVNGTPEIGPQHKRKGRGRGYEVRIGQ